MSTTHRPTSRAALAAAAVGVLLLLTTACTAPDGGAGPVLDATLSAAGGSGSPGTAASQTPTVTAEETEQAVRAADGSQARVSAGSTDLLTEVPVDIPIVAGDTDLVQVADDGTVYVVVTSPGTTADVWSRVLDELAVAAFLTEDVSPDAGSPVLATAAGVFSGGGHRVTVGLAPAGRASTTVTYLVVPTP